MEPSEAVAKAGFSKSLEDCDLQIQKAFPLVKSAFCAAHPELNLRVDYTYRSPALQFELFKKGRVLDIASGEWILVDTALKVTDKDGVVKKGEHNYYPSKAADIYITHEDKILWPNRKDAAVTTLYEELGALWVAQSLISGATWKHDWKDDDHVQVAA